MTAYKKTFVEEIHEHGVAVGEASGEARGIGRGIAKGEARALLRFLDAKYLEPLPEQRSRVMSCTDVAQLERWIDRVVTARTAAEVFAD
jgi:hypothetical protein